MNDPILSVLWSCHASAGGACIHTSFHLEAYCMQASHFSCEKSLLTTTLDVDEMSAPSRRDFSWCVWKYIFPHTCSDQNLRLPTSNYSF